MLEQRDELLHHSFYFFGDWDLSTHPDHYPGAWHGEASFIGPDAEGQTVISVPWPLSTLAQLEVRAPVLEDGAWTATLFPGALGGLLDGLGDALAQFPLAGLLPIDPQLFPSAVEELRQHLSLRVSLSAARERIFQLRIALPAGLGGAAGLPIAELAGQALVLRGGASFVLAGTVSATALQLDASLQLDAGTGFALTGPLISALEEGRRALSLLSDDQRRCPRWRSRSSPARRTRCRWRAAASRPGGSPSRPPSRCASPPTCCPRSTCSSTAPGCRACAWRRWTASRPGCRSPSTAWSHRSAPRRWASSSS
ncbi:MAG: hypothetical protein IPI49_32045 [Myxococcales bacterium]|nr:hypothetical protein [Myxococcales bacterium]